MSATFDVSLSSASGRSVSVDYATANGTAIAPVDYLAATGTLNFAAGETTKQVTVLVNGDLLDEANETYFLNLSNAANATIADGQGLGTITNDDGQPSLSVNDVTVTEGDSGTTSATFTVTLAPASGQNVSVDYSTADGTATAPADYAATSGTLTFAPGQTTRTATVQVAGDMLDELDETFTVNLSDAVNAAIADGIGLGTILDDDPLPALSINDVTVTEPDTGTTNATFTVSLNAPSARAISVAYATADGTATAPADYAPGSGSLTFAAGETSKQVTVLVNGDVLDEANETYFVNLSNPSNATIGDGQGLGTITDDDPLPALSVNDVTVTEGNFGTTQATYTVSLNATSGRAVSVDYATADLTATAPADYLATSGTLNFAAGETTKQVTVLVNGDLVDEANETFALNLTDAVSASIADGQGIGTVTDDDALPALSIDDVTVTEGNSGTVSATFTVTLTPTSGRAVTVEYATANGTAQAPGDYQAATGSLTFAAGQSTRTVTVLVNGDTLDEDNETFFLNLSNPGNATITDGTGVGTIGDDDGMPALSINDVAVTEGQSGTTNATFTVTLSSASGNVVTANYATADGTATAPADYTATAGIVTFPVGITTRTITVPVAGDLLDEINETYTLNLSNPTNASIADGTGLGTITDDDATPSLSINDVTVTEGDAGTVNATFTVGLSAPSGLNASVDFATADGTATAPADYNAASGTLTFTPGQTSKQVTVQVKGDLLDEASETYFVNLSNPANATISDGQGVGTITDNDPLPSLSINDVTVTEGNTGTVAATYTVTLNAQSGRQVTVEYATANGTAQAPADYQAGNGTLTFTPGQTTRQLTVLVNGDLLDEADETYIVNLSNPGNATITDGQGAGTITDDDAPPALSVNDVAVIEGDAGNVQANFTVTLDVASGRNVSVNYATADETAQAPGDYQSRTGSVTFAAGETSKTVNVPVRGDVIDESNETYFLNLSTPTNATILDGQGIGTIIDDDGLPFLSINDVTIVEGNTGTVNASFAVTLSSPSEQTVSVGWATADGSAHAPDDYVATGGNVVFNPGQTTKTVIVQVRGDLLDEIDENYLVNLSGPVNATIGDGQGVGTITDNDAPPALSVNDVTVTEGNTGTVNANFTVSLNVPSGRAVTVDFATADGTAQAPDDYQAGAGTVTFAAGQTSRQVTLLVNGDLLDEANETFFFNLTNPTNATISDGQGVGTITDDDPMPALSVGDVTLAEGDAGTVDATFTVTLNAPSGRNVSVDYATADDTAHSPDDYVARNGQLVFTPSQMSKQVTVQVNGDSLDEANEAFFLNLTNAFNATIQDGQGLGTITDDDGDSSLSIDDVILTEGNGGSVNATFTVTLAPTSGQAVTVDYATANGTATAGSDYQPSGGTLTFEPGESSMQVETLAVPVFGDSFFEGDETFFVNLTNPVNATIADGEGLGTIMNDDAPPPPPPPPLPPPPPHLHRHRRRHLRLRRALAVPLPASRRVAADAAAAAPVALHEEGALLQRPAVPERKQDPQHLARSSSAQAAQALALQRANIPSHPGFVHMARLARLRHAQEAELRLEAGPKPVQDRRPALAAAGARPYPLAGPLGAAQPAPGPDRQHARHRDRDPERERDVLRRSGDEASSALEERGRRVHGRHRVQPAVEQGERHIHRREEQDQEYGQLHDRARLHRAQPHRDTRRPERSGEVHDQREGVQRDEVDSAAADVHSHCERDDGQDHRGHGPAPCGRQGIAGDDSTSLRRGEHQPAREPVFEVPRDAEAREDAAERSRLEQHEHELERRVPVREVEAGDVVDPRQPAGEGGEEEEREDQPGQEQRGRREDVVQDAPGDGEGDGPELSAHVRVNLSERAHVAAAIDAIAIAAANPKASASACQSQPAMIKLRRPSIRYEIGLKVATIRNQSVSIKFRGRFIDDRKRPTKSSGKRPCTASPDPVRSAKNAPNAPKAIATVVASTSRTIAPVTPVSRRTPMMSATAR